MKITRWKKAAIAAVCGAITFGSLAVFSACDDKDKINEITAGNTVSQFVPTDGSKPTDHTGMENLAYLNYRLQTADAYSVEAYGTVTAQIVISYTQEVWTYKDYKDGVMVVEDISTSSLVNTASQSCFVGEKVLMRSPASDNKKNWNGRETEWKTDDPAVYTKAAYERTYGLLCTEFSVYVLNENTIEEISAPQRNDDGTYSMTLTLDGDKAGQYYVRRMKTMGGLSDYPTFNGVTVTYTFNENWQVLSSRTEENYAFKMGMLSSEKTKAVTDQTYSYDENKVDISAYTDFFSSYEKVAASDEAQEEKEPTVTDYLAEAFAPVLAGPVCFDATVTYGGADVAGEIYVNAATLSDLKLRARLGNVRLWFEGGSIYSLVNGTYVSLPAESVAVFTGGEGFSADTFSLDSLLEQLTGGEFTASQTGAVLQSRLTLAGLELPVKFVFTRDGRKLGLESVALDGLNVGGESLCVSLSYAALSSAPAALTSEEKSSAVDLSGYLTAASDLLQKDAFDLSVCLNTAEISLSATATVFTDGAADGNFSLGYKNQTLSGAFALADGYFYADIARSEGKEPLRFSLALSSLSEVLSLAGVSVEGTALPDISTLAKAALGLGQKSLFTDAAVTEDTLTVVLDGDALAALFSLDTGLGEISLTFGADGALSLSGAGLSLGLSGAEGVARPAIDGSGYVDLTPVVSQAEEIYALLEEKTLCFDLDCSFDFSGVTARVTLTGGVEWKDGFAFGAQGNIEVAGTSHEVAFGWENNLLTLVYGNAGFKVRTSGSELDELKAAFRQVFEKCSEYLSGVALPDGENLASIASLGAFGALLGEDGLSLNALLDAIELSVSADPLTVLLVVCSDNALSLGFDGETVSLSASLNFGEVKGSAVATLSKGEGIPAEKEIDFISTAQLKGFLNYVLDVFALAEEEEIALDISMTVRDGDEAYREVGFVRYTVSGSIVLDKRHAYATEDGGTEESFAASLSLAVESTTDEKSYYFTAAIYQGWFFLSVSYYNDPATENYHPLFMKGNLREISAILGTVKRVAGYDMPFLDELLSSFGSLASGGETDELWCVSDMIGSLSLSDDGLSLVLKGDTVFGGAGAGDLAFTLGRGEEGVLLKMENLVYRTSPLSSLDISVGLSVSSAEISDPALSAEYIDISSLNEVLDSVLGSFFAFGTDEDGNETMDLLDGYYFSGVVSGSFGSCSVDFDVSISLRRERGR